eukprot:578973-Rhodomonas_salina.1
MCIRDSSVTDGCVPAADGCVAFTTAKLTRGLRAGATRASDTARTWGRSTGTSGRSRKSAWRRPGRA